VQTACEVVPFASRLTGSEIYNFEIASLWEFITRSVACQTNEDVSQVFVYIPI